MVGRMVDDFESRAAEFLAGLQALTERTGVVVLLNDSGDPYTPEPIVLGEAKGVSGAYRHDGYELTWVTDAERDKRATRRGRRATPSK
jgi:hypothetical protein